MNLELRSIREATIESASMHELARFSRCTVVFAVTFATVFVPSFASADDSEGLLPIEDCNGNGVEDSIDVSSESDFHDAERWAIRDLEDRLEILVSGDLEGDGTLEQIAAERSGRVSVVRDLTGVARLQTIWEAEDHPIGLFVRDLDLDGDGDLVLLTVQNLGSLGDGVLRIIGNLGAGSFEEHVLLTRQDGVLEVSVSDFDDDGWLDLALAIRRDPAVLIFRGLGGLQFDPPETVQLVRAPSQFNVIDLDRDGREDIIANEEELSQVVWLAATEDGGFLPSQILWSERIVEDFIGADIDGDGAEELLTLLSERRSEATSVEIARPGGLGGEPFVLERLRLKNEATELLVKDVDTDGNVDLVVVYRHWQQLGIHLGTGNGQFDDPIFVAYGSRYQSSVQFTTLADGRSGLLSWVEAASEIVFQEFGPNFVERMTSIAWYEQPDHSFVAPVMGDLDQDGRDDLVIHKRHTGQVTLGFAPGLPTGFFGVWRPIHPTSQTYRVALVDLDRDGDLDVVESGPTIAIHVNLGGAVFGAARGIPLGTDPGNEAFVDLDGDAAPEIVVGVGRGAPGALIYWNSGAASFSGPTRIRLASNTSAPPVAVFAGDFDGDGRGDLLIDRYADLPAALYSGLRGRRFSAPESLSAVSLGGDAQVADFDGDGDLDLATVRRSTEGVDRLEIYRNPGNGRFETRSGHGTTMSPSRLSSLDIDGNGALDLLLTYSTFPTPDFPSRDGGVRVYFGDGRGRFTIEDLEPAAQRLDGVAAGDIDGDGWMDLTFRAHGDQEDPIRDWIGVFRRFVRRAQSTDRNENRIPDECERPQFYRGDADGNGTLDMTDSLRILAFLIIGESKLPCLEAADVNGDGELDVSDAVYGLLFLFQGSAAPPLPGPPGGVCGPDTDPRGSPADLGCDRYAACSDGVGAP
jgi:hypothetical protein